jgi:hypothetical protein
MPYPKAFRDKYLARIDELVADAEDILKRKIVVPTKYSRHAVTFGGDPAVDVPEHTLIEHDKFVVYRTSAATLLGSLVHQGNPNYEVVRGITACRAEETAVVFINGLLRSVKEDMAKGFLDDIADRIEAAVAADYLTQAEALMAEGGKGAYDHVPAAVLAGAVLEKALRSMCDRNNPAIPTDFPDGKHKTMNPLIDDLKKAGLFNEMRAKQLRAWADIRNHAAHGKFSEFTANDVGLMIRGISDFLV